MHISHAMVNLTVFATLGVESKEHVLAWYEDPRSPAGRKGHGGNTSLVAVSGMGCGTVTDDRPLGDGGFSGGGKRAAEGDALIDS